ncbi:MAG: class I SAM-dependent methyltransferase [Candidatus Aenigmatarchaeota archaeon]|nr:MAG: class I SAM-dependent methyltransferase [Candidatus Aenigmarchaeota archaeon]
MPRRVYRRLLFQDLEKIYAQLAGVARKPNNGRRFLDVGASFGFEVLKRESEGYDAYGLEINAENALKATRLSKKYGRELMMVIGDAQNMPFRDGAFDSVHCRHVIEHVPDDAGVIEGMKAALKKDGIMEVVVPNLRNLHTAFHSMLGLPNELRFTDRTHLREYTKEQLLGLLEASGVRVERVEMRGFNPPLGMKVMILLDHFVPVSRTIGGLGKTFPRRSAEIYAEAIKKS